MSEKLETMLLPAKCGEFMDERCSRLIRRVGIAAQWGTIDLKQLARDCYFQGVIDTIGHLEEKENG